MLRFEVETQEEVLAAIAAENATKSAADQFMVQKIFRKGKKEYLAFSDRTEYATFMADHVHKKTAREKVVADKAEKADTVEL